MSRLKENCTGCKACGDICPTNAISFCKDTKGFFYPSINRSVCVGCKQCKIVCPIQSMRVKNDEAFRQKVYSACAKSRDIRNRGSSGGIFELLARKYLKLGYSVCGAAFDDGLQLHHVLVNSEDELHRILKSKYLQSDCAGIYKSIRELLAKGGRLLFSGTPCQIAALKSFLSLYNLGDDVIYVDIVCHGTPSQAMFSDYIKELGIKREGDIVDFGFRHKTGKEKHAHGYYYSLRDGVGTKTYSGIYTNSSFYYLFKNQWILRDSCYSCVFASLKRDSDITLGDFWGIEKIDRGLDTDLGVSMVVINTEKGEKAFALLRDSIAYNERDLCFAVQHNYCLTNHTQKPLVVDRLFSDYEARGYSYISRKYFRKNFLKRCFYKVYWILPIPMRKIIRRMR